PRSAAPRSTRCSAAAIGFGSPAITIPIQPSASTAALPKAWPSGRWRSPITRRCFAGDGKPLVMPAFGAYAGGLNIRDPAIVALFGALSFTAHMLSERRIYAVAAARCLAD